MGSGPSLFPPQLSTYLLVMTVEESSAPQGEVASAMRCGYVALIGAPNVGKSTLLNAFVGEDLSIVTAKAQTTWQRITGIRTSGIHQMIFLDTPGIVAPVGLLHRSLLFSVEEATREADIIVILSDPVQSLIHRERERIEEVLGRASAVRIGVVNKVDIADVNAIRVERQWLEDLCIPIVHLVSARRGTGMEELVRVLGENLPSGPFLYPEEDVASAPVRFFIAEMVREAIFKQFHEEIPYASICRVEEFRDAGSRTYIQVTIYVERASQKGILIGAQGQAIRSLGTSARSRIEHFLDKPVYLDLWVKVLPGWRRKPEQLQRLGIPVPREDRVQ